MAILFTTVDYPPMEGGISSLCHGLARAAQSQVREVVVLGPRLKGTGLRSLEDGIRVYRSPFYWASYMRLLPFLVLFPLLALIYRAKRVIAFNIGYGGLAAYLFRPFLQFDYLVYAYGFEFLKYKKNRFIRALYLRIYDSAAAVVAISRFAEKELIAFGVRRDKIILIHPGVDPGAFADPGPARRRSIREKLGLQESPFFLCVSRFVERKGHVPLLNAFCRAAQSSDSVKLLLVGRGPALQGVRREADRLGISNRVVFTGYVAPEELVCLYHEAMAFVLLPQTPPDRRDAEGFGIVFLEAACCGLPCIATRTGGVEEAVLHDVTGFVCEQGDLAGIERAMKRLVQEPDLGPKLGKAGRRRVLAGFTWTGVADKIAAVWESRS